MAVKGIVQLWNLDGCVLEALQQLRIAVFNALLGFIKIILETLKIEYLYVVMVKKLVQKSVMMVTQIMGMDEKVIDQELKMDGFAQVVLHQHLTFECNVQLDFIKIIQPTLKIAFLNEVMVLKLGVRNAMIVTLMMVMVVREIAQ